MNSFNLISEDESTRIKALDITKSHIVQAPAGSGKTELLTQRYLNLLAKAVSSPEEIIAITFTRKAAAEMRERILGALNYANNNPEPCESHKKTTWKLARAALLTNKKNDWQLLNNPNRLRILTIDALSTLLNAQIPILSHFGAKPNIANDPSVYYEKAVIALFENPCELEPSIHKMLLHLDNNASQCLSLLTNLLKRRDQWLPHIIPHYQDPESLRKILEKGLTNLVDETLQQLSNCISGEIKEKILPLAAHAAEALRIQNPTHPIVACLDLTVFPPANNQNLKKWQGIAELLLGKNRRWRKTVDKRHGFSTENKSIKKQMVELLNELQDNDQLLDCFINALNCPPSHYSEGQWEIIAALLEILPTLVAQLHLQFRQHNAVDFVELTLGALRALGNSLQPTDLALYLDHQIRHLLVDEFQDTSIMQHQLLKKITQEWQPTEGKTLFLVGDPMQSIYRFRNAEVGLFLQVQHAGIENITLQRLLLQQNFRSQADIIKWINQTFSNIFPKKNDITTGAVSYSSAISPNQSQPNEKVHYYCSSMDNDEDYTKKILDIIKCCQNKGADDSIAILVRSRSNLKAILPALEREKLGYQAVELQTLKHRQEVIDLVTLTKALLHPADRIAWLALLRCPWCGLTLSDLHEIASHANKKPIWSSLLAYESIAKLSIDGQQRLKKIVPILSFSKQMQGRDNLASWVRNTWLTLNGEAWLTKQSSRKNTKAYFDLIEQIEHEFSFALLERKLATLFARPEPSASCNIQVMTIHKSKGLEFDHVILPELQASTPNEPNQLLMWLDRPNQKGDNDLIIAPVKANHESFDPIHRQLKIIENRKLTCEVSRLLYVACTRAKKSLHLCARLKVDHNTGDLIHPPTGSFLDLLWPNHQNYFINAFESDGSKSTETPAKRKFLRFKKLTPLFDQSTPLDKKSSDKNHPVPKPAKQKLAILIGTLVHETLASIVNLSKFNINDSQKHWRRRLTQLNVDRDNHFFIIKKLSEAFEKIKQDKLGCWLLHPHKNANNEYPISFIEGNEVIHQIIDRTFIDKDNIRWIIDYKTTLPDSISASEFLLQQKVMHEKQLSNYARTMRHLDPRKIKLGLYFPLCQQWIEWDWP